MLCANSRLSGCQEVLRGKGNIFCDKCSELRKTLTKVKREQDIEELIQKNLDLEKENMRLRQNIFEIKINYDKEIKSLIEEIEKKSIEQDKKIKELRESKKEIEYLNTELEKLNRDMEYLNLQEKIDNNRLECQLTEMQKEIFTLKEENLLVINDKDKYKLLYDQLKIDLDKLKLERPKEILTPRLSNINSIPSISIPSISIPSISIPNTPRITPVNNTPLL
jgi:DNA repair exonuclease SbcCD ATPase subunit